MVQIGSIPQHAGQASDVIVSLCSIAVMLCMVVVLLGIKFRWFKQRLTFEPIPTGTNGSTDQVVLRSSRNTQEQFRQPVAAQGTFRKTLDEDFVIERPKTLPPVRVRKSSKGPPTFRPPKRSEARISVLEEPVVAPPPPPPLPSAAETEKLFAKSRVRTAPTEENEERKVNFDSLTHIIPNGKADNTCEELLNEEDKGRRPSVERRPTGYVRPSEDLMQELQDLEDEIPKAQPRSILSDKPKETFKKKSPKSTKFAPEPPKSEEDQIDSYKLNQRRLTGFFAPGDEDRANIEEIAAQHNSEKETHSKVVFALDNDDDDDDDEAKYPPPPPISPPPVLFSSQVSADDDADNWSAIQRHRNLAQEISEQHEARQNRMRENAETMASTPSEFRNPLAAQQQQQPQQQQPKPRTMRDMKRNNARNDLLLDGEREDTEA